MWNMKVTVTEFVIDALGALIKGLVQGLDNLEVRGWVKTIQTIALLRSARILRIVLETWGNFCHSNSTEKPSTNTGVKNSQNNNNKYFTCLYTTDYFQKNKMGGVEGQDEQTTSIK